MSSTSERREGWRRPIKAVAAQASGIPVLPGQPQVAWTLVGPHRREDERRLLRAEACCACLQTFPARPMRATSYLFRDEFWGRPSDEALRLVSEQRCPVCGCEVSPEMAVALMVPDRWQSHPAAA